MADLEAIIVLTVDYRSESQVESDSMAGSIAGEWPLSVMGLEAV